VKDRLLLSSPDGREAFFSHSLGRLQQFAREMSERLVHLAQQPILRKPAQTHLFIEEHGGQMRVVIGIFLPNIATSCVESSTSIRHDELRTQPEKIAA